jgi:DNA-binding NarL/FixJ family response regulator
MEAIRTFDEGHRGLRVNAVLKLVDLRVSQGRLEEAEVLELLSHGLSNREIAARLVLSAKTLEHHVSQVLGKLGLRNRSEAAAFLLNQRSTP